MAGRNAGKEPLKLKITLPMFAGKKVTVYDDDKKRNPRMTETSVKADGTIQLVIQPEGGMICLL